MTGSFFVRMGDSPLANRKEDADKLALQDPCCCTEPTGVNLCPDEFDTCGSCEFEEVVLTLGGIVNGNTPYSCAVRPFSHISVLNRDYSLFSYIVVDPDCRYYNDSVGCINFFGFPSGGNCYCGSWWGLVTGLDATLIGSRIDYPPLTTGFPPCVLGPVAGSPRETEGLAIRPEISLQCFRNETISLPPLTGATAFDGLTWTGGNNYLVGTDTVYLITYEFHQENPDLCGIDGVAYWALKAPSSASGCPPLGDYEFLGAGHTHLAAFDAEVAACFAGSTANIA
jgi:hypothetical protein